MKIPSPLVRFICILVMLGALALASEVMGPVVLAVFAGSMLIAHEVRKVGAAVKAAQPLVTVLESTEG